MPATAALTPSHLQHRRIARAHHPVLLYRARKAKGLTQAEVAEKLGVPQSWVAKIEIGERRIDVVEFDEIALMLGINVPRFFRELRKNLSS